MYQQQQHSGWLFRTFKIAPPPQKKQNQGGIETGENILRSASAVWESKAAALPVRNCL